MPDELKPLCRVEILRIEGDVYINGKRSVFMVDAGDRVKPTFEDVDWLLGWAKIGLMSKGHTVPHFPAGRKGDLYGSNRRDTSAPPTEEKDRA